MGTWGHRNFENDTAADFVGDFQDLPGEALLLAALANALEEEGLIESDAAAEALAAAEIVATALGKPAPDFPAELLPLTAALDLGEDSELQEMAQEAVEAILTASELKDQWEETGDFMHWQAAQRDLLARLQ
jgi:hypothetical protein